MQNGDSRECEKVSFGHRSNHFHISAGRASGDAKPSNSVAVDTKFVVYVGGGSNISPPPTIGSGGGIPMISIGQGSTFLAGQVSAKDEKSKLVKLSLSVNNSTKSAVSFKIGDINFAVDRGTPSNDFVAVGYGSQLCAMSDEDRKKVKETIVDVAPASTRNLSFVFPLLSEDAKRGELVLGNAAPVSFEISAKGAPRRK